MRRAAPRAILITHVWSDRNKGDAAILEATIDLIRACDPGVIITLMSEFAPDDRRLETETAVVRARFPDATLVGSLFPVLPVESSIDPPDAARPAGRLRTVYEILTALVRSAFLLAAPHLPHRLGSGASTALEAARAADLVISKGGGFLYGDRSLRSTARLYRELFPLLLARRLGKRVALLGQSIGPFPSRLQQRLVRWALRDAVVIGVREALSLDTVRSLGVAGGRVRIVPDPALALSPAEPGEADLQRLCAALACYPRPWIGLTVRRWDRRGGRRSQQTYERYLSALAALCAHVREVHGGTVVIWPQSTGPDSFEDDRSAGRDLLRHDLLGRAADRVLNVDAEYEPRVLKAAYGMMDAFVATRLHSALFAMGLGVPSLVLDYWGPKAAGVMALLEQDRYVLPYSGLDAGSLCQTFDDLWARRHEIRAHLTAAVPRLIDTTTQAVRDLVGFTAPAVAPDAEDGRLSVLLVGLNSSFGGVEQHLADLCTELASRGHRVALVTPRASLLAETVRRCGTVDVYEIPRSPVAVVALRRLILSVRPDVVHLHSPRASVLGRLAARLLPAAVRGRTVVLSTAHGWISMRLKLRRLFEALYNWSASWEDGILAVAGAVRANLIRSGYPQRIWIVPNGINPARHNGPLPARAVADQPFCFGYFGRLEREKGLDGLVDALAQMGSPDWRLDVCGDGRDRKRLERRVAVAGLQGRVRFFGALHPEAVRARMAECHAIVLPSVQEGWPYVILEAMSLGVPVVASAVGGWSR